MVESLLSLRLSVLVQSFAGSRSVAQIAVAWERLRLQFVLLHGAAIETQQLKNKYQALKKEYTTIMNANSATGNRTDEPIVLPAYWSVLTQFLGDKRGLGSVDFMQTAHADTETVTAAKRKAEVDAEIESQRETRRKKEKVDIGQGMFLYGPCSALGMLTVNLVLWLLGLVLLGENLAKALAHGRADTPTASLDAIAQQQTKIMVAMEQNQRQLITHMESASAVNAALLAFMTKPV